MAKHINIGGLYGQKEQAYLLTEWIEKLESKSQDFQYKTFKMNLLTQHVNFKSRTWAMNLQNPKGKELELIFESNLPQLKASFCISVYNRVINKKLILSSFLFIFKSGCGKV